MKKIFNFSQFVNENYKINEGGGAGIDFKTNVDLTALYELSHNSIKMVKQDISMSDTFDAHGYEDGMSNVGTWMLKASGGDPDIKKIMQIPISSIESNEDRFFDDIEMPDKNRADIKKLGDVFIAMPELVLNLSFDLSYKNYREMHFGGYSRGSFKKEDIIIGNEGTKYDGGDYDSITISYGTASHGGPASGYDIYTGDSQIGELIDDVRPQLAATDKFLEFYKEVFNNHDSYNSYIKSELIDNDLTADVVTDEEIQEYIDSNDLDLDVATIRNNADKYVDEEFVEFMKNQSNYNDMKWETYQIDLGERYGKDNSEE